MSKKIIVRTIIYYNSLMDEYIKQSIDSRKNAMSATYDISAEMQKKIDSLFAEIEKLGKSSKDVGEFETKFQSGPLNQKYLDLFTEIATTSTPKVSAGNVEKPSIGKIVAENAALGVASNVVDRTKRAILPTRAQINQKATDKIRKTPIVGDVLDASEKASYASHLSKIFKKKK